MPTLTLPPCEIPVAPTVTTGPQWRQQHPTWLLAALRAGSITAGGADAGTTYRLDVHALGTLPLPDGRIAGCDPYLADLELEPFDATVPPGEHPAGVGVVTIEDDHVRPTALLVVTGTAPVVRWDLARAADDAEDDAGTGEDDADRPGLVVGYGVDAGTGALFSPLALPALVEVKEQDAGMLEDPLSEQMEDSPVEAVLLPPRDGALPVLQAHSGWGDGVYATWIGRDADGAVSLVMTDFAVVPDPWAPADDDLDDDEDVDDESDDESDASSSRRPWWRRLFG